MTAAADYEKLGQLYIGREHDVEKRKTTDRLVLYDSKDLVTHAVVLGMTGSGKTGLCIDVIEEAALDGVPSIRSLPEWQEAAWILFWAAGGGALVLALFLLLGRWAGALGKRIRTVINTDQCDVV